MCNLENIEHLYNQSKSSTIEQSDIMKFKARINLE